MRIAVLGLGASGSHVARQLGASDIDEILLYDADSARMRLVIGAMSGSAAARSGEPDGAGADIVILATPGGNHLAAAQQALANGAHVVSMSDDVSDVRSLLALDEQAAGRGLSVLVGCGFAPGLTCLLAVHAANLLDEVVEIAVAKAGTGGPECARHHHRAMKQDALDWIDGQWILRRGGSGRDLAWFPPPIGAHDCYRASLPSPLLLQRRFPEAGRIAARVTATRRDRFTKRLPMLRRPHADGGPGAVRVELRGRKNGVFETVVYAAMHHPSVASGTVAAVTALQLAGHGGRPPWPAGARGLAEVGDPLPILQELHGRGLRLATFQGLTWNA